MPVMMIVFFLDRYGILFSTLAMLMFDLASFFVCCFFPTDLNTFLVSLPKENLNKFIQTQI